MSIRDLYLDPDHGPARGRRLETTGHLEFGERMLAYHVEIFGESARISATTEDGYPVDLTIDEREAILADAATNGVTR